MNSNKMQQYRDRLAADLAQAIAARQRLQQAIVKAQARGENTTGMHYIAGLLAADIRNLDKELAQ